MRKSVLVATVLMGALGLARPAAACGGFFEPPSPPIVIPGEEGVQRVAGQRWIYATSPDQTTLYAELTYRGEPSRFAWVLPVKGTPDVGVGNPALFGALEEVTAMRVESPPIQCRSSGGYSESGGGAGCACFPVFGAAGVGGDFGDAGSTKTPGEEEVVTVVRSETVGPYETVIVRSNVPTALVDWLEANGYAIPDYIRPAIAEYTQQGFDFLAVRFQDPNARVRIMQPIRVTMPGPATNIPARMAAAGGAEAVPVVLYLVSGGEQSLDGFQHARIDTTKLSWDWAQDRSNYPELLESALTPLPNARFPSLVTSYVETAPWAPIAQAYKRLSGHPDCDLSGLLDVAKVVRSCARVGDPEDGGADASAQDAGSGDAGTSDGGEPTAFDPRPCKDPDIVPIDRVSCDPSSRDLGELLVGSYAARTTVTRLELRLSRAEPRDLTVIPYQGKNDGTAGNRKVATISVNPPCELASREPKGPGTSSNATAFALVGLGFAAWRRRQSRR